MPPKPSWLKRIPAIRATLEGLSEPLLDRAAIEQLFRVSPRRAMRLAHDMGARQVGHALVVEREDVLAFVTDRQLERVRVLERARRRHLRDAIEEAQRDLAARRVRITMPATGSASTLRELPSSVALGPNGLHVTFTDPQDLLRQLLLLSRAIAHDYPAFEDAIAVRGAQPAAP